MSKGFTDKLYWRMGRDGKWHCFKKTHYVGEKKHVFTSLCDREELPKSYGGEILRPHPILRCAICDGLEMIRRGVDESMPATC